MGRGDAEPRLAAARLGVRRLAAQRRPDRHDPARADRRREGAGHAVRLRRPARPHPAVHVPGRAGGAPPPVVASGRRRRARRVPQRAQAAADDGPRRRCRRHASARSCSARSCSRWCSAPTTSPAGRSPCSPSAAPATWSRWRSPRPSSPSRATPSSPLGWFIGVVAFLLGTWLSSDDLFRRVEIGLLLSSIASMAAFALALRYRLASGVGPRQRLDDGRHHRHAVGDMTHGPAPPPASPPEDVGQSSVTPALRASSWRSWVTIILTRVGEVDLGLPAELGAGLGGVTDQQVDLGGPVELGVLAHVAPPVLDPRLGEGPLDELLDRCGSRRWPPRSRRARSCCNISHIART